ncbi:MAG: hypothetical protein EPO12_07215 [Aquabacterium sp.]|jgi:transcriptional regulator EpsA|nr:MAG: hypothetical protein EPO12_07215 [Aquabacterium sp.]
MSALMQPPVIAPEDSECLLRIVEGAALVRRRYQFFLWTQADMQRLLPHKLVVCGAYDRGTRDMSFEPLHSVPLPAPALASLADGRAGLTRHLVTAWSDMRQQPTLIGLQALAQKDASAAALHDSGYERLLVHGVCRPGRPADLESFFIFGSPEDNLDEAAVHALGLLLPYLHSVYLRVHTIEGELAGGPAAMPAYGAQQPRGLAITEREREILRWVREGMSNHQIGTALNISALTVKNHVQKILRKLGAANRAQAVAKAMAMNLFNMGPGGMSSGDQSPGL